MQCRICGSNNTPSEFFTSVKSFRCNECLSVQVIDLPSDEEISSFYNNKYINSYTAGMDPKKFFKEMPKRFQSKIKLIKKYSELSPITKLLDIGVGDGMFLEQINSKCIAVGVDISLKDTYPSNIKVVQGRFDILNGLPFENNSFDIITNWAVIEHLKNPAQAIKEAFRVLKPGGLLFCETPLSGDYVERLSLGRSHWICPPEHLHVFSAIGLQKIHTTNGFKTLNHYQFFERNFIRWIARRVRNVTVGLFYGGLYRILSPLSWSKAREANVTQIGDIQILISQKLE